MEEFVYILIIVVWLAISIVKSNKRKAAASMRPATTSKSKTRGFEEIMAEILGANEPHQAQQVPVFEEGYEEDFAEEEVGMAYQSLEDLYMTEMAEDSNDLHIEEPKKDNIEPQNKRSKSRKQHFDLRTAIIYQAIMERPYI